MTDRVGIGVLDEPLSDEDLAEYRDGLEEMRLGISQPALTAEDLAGLLATIAARDELVRNREEEIRAVAANCDTFREACKSRAAEIARLSVRVSDLKFALGDNAGWFDRARAAEARVAKLEAALREARKMLDLDGRRSTVEAIDVALEAK